VTRHGAEIALGLLAVVCTVALLAGIATAEDARMAREDESQRAQAIEVGADLYDLHCRSCHGSNGQGVGQMGPALADARFFTDRLREVGWPGALEDYVTATTELGRLIATRPLYAGDGVVVMAPWSDNLGGPLRRDQIRDVAAFVLNWRATALGEVDLKPLEMPRANLDDPEAIARGREIFGAVGCSGCHAVDGVSAEAVGPDLSRVASVAASRQPGLTSEEYLREAILIPNAYYVEGFEQTAESTMCGGVLSEEQLDELVAFLLTLD
jgi:mono/diheme cytochrome c family protein